MVVTITIYVNTTVIMTMTGAATRIMIMAVSKTMIMTVVATTTMAKNMTINMTKIFKQAQKDNFYCLLRMIKKAMKIQFALLL